MVNCLKPRRITLSLRKDSTIGSVMTWKTEYSRSTINYHNEFDMVLLSMFRGSGFWREQKDRHDVCVFIHLVPKYIRDIIKSREISTQ